MGSVYRRQVRFCTTCRRRLDTTAARKACEASGHAIELRDQPIWWIKYQVAGRSVSVSAESTKKEDAKRLLRDREHAVDMGALVTPRATRVTFDDAAEDLINDYVTNKRRSLRTMKGRLTKHLTPYFQHQRLASISTVDVRAYTAKRQTEGASNATINRELIHLKRMCTLAHQAGKLVGKPYIPLLKENNVRKGFFEPEQFESVKQHLPVYMRGIVEFAHATGWRTPSEILPLEWRQVDMAGGEVRLDPGTTKNGEGRTFPLTRAVRRILEAQQRVAAQLRRKGTIVRHVFCFTEGEKAGKGITESGFNKAFRKARLAAGCPGRIAHDFRRTAVRNFVRAGVSERVAMQLTGHKTRAVFERYNIINAGDLRAAAEQIDRSTSAR